jgi:hypothetical protein
MKKLYDILKEIGNITFSNIDFDENKFLGTFNKSFKINNNYIDVTIGGWRSSLNSLDKIFNTDYEKKLKQELGNMTDNDYLQSNQDPIEYYEKFQKQFFQKYNIPTKIQNSYELGFTVNDEQTSTKTRINTQINFIEKIKRYINNLTNELENLKKYKNPSPEINQLIDEKEGQIQRGLEAISKTKDSIEKEKNNISVKNYLDIVSEVANIINEFIRKYNPDIIIINREDEYVPNEDKIKRDKIYEYYFNKYKPSGYKLNKKNNILYLSK